MNKILKISLIIFFIITLLGVFGLTQSPQKGIISSLGGMFFCILLGIIVILKEKPPLKRIAVIVAVFFISTFILFHIGVFMKIKSNKVCYFSGPDRYQKWENIKQVNLTEIDNRIDSFKDYFNIFVIKQIYYKKDTFKIYFIRNKVDSATRKILIVSAIHGSEPSGYLAIPEILSEIRNNPQKYKRWNINVVSPLNPVGLSLFSRENECGCDINRDFKIFKTDQSVMIKDILNKTKYDIVLDLHEGTYRGHAILTNKIYDEKLNKSLKDYLSGHQYNLSDFAYSEKNISIRGFLKSYPRDNFLKYFDETKVLAQYNEDYGIMNITSESDASLIDMNKRIQGHLIVFKGIIDYYNEN
jgi:hypothetical protein